MAYCQRQPLRRHILPQPVRAQLRLNIPEQIRDALLLAHPLALLFDLVRVELGRLAPRVSVCAIERGG